MRKLGIALAVALFLAGAAVQFSQYLPDLPSWIEVRQSPVGAVIVEESGDRTTLAKTRPGLIVVLSQAPDCNVLVVDKDVKGRDLKTPAELLPYIEAAKGQSLPQLVLRWSSGKFTAQPCPDTMDKLKEALR